MTDNFINCELHNKMCRKIAQLTRVINVLSCKTEDAEGIVHNIKENSDDEIGRIPKEANDRVADAQQAVADKVEGLEFDLFDSRKKLKESKGEIESVKGELESARKEIERLQKALGGTETRLHGAAALIVAKTAEYFKA